jgi:hypothetical protein
LCKALVGAAAARLVLLSALAMATLLAGCASSHHVRPLGRGNVAGHASLGGPLVGLGGDSHGPALVIPTPILTLGGSYGVRSDASVTASLDATALLFGVAHLEAGAVYHPIIRESGAVPTLTTVGGVHLLTNVADTRVAPFVTGAAAWRVRQRHLVYTGVDLALAIGTPTRVVWGPLVGGQARLGQRVGLSLELKWLVPQYDVGPLAPAWISPGSHGYLSVLVGLNLYFGDVR